ncbi:MAG TPA: KH domain-containing protein [Candidatus Saccharimonadales bacterium]|nr:KH domain-containing protein [Candidatus Saccharimonadales bacterium]
MSITIDQQFIEYIVKSLVSKPDEVKVERRIDEKGVLLELTVDPEDLGRVIGKRGATAQSLRTLLRALGTKQEARYNLKIVDTGSDYQGGSRNSSAPTSSSTDDSNGVSSGSSDDYASEEPTEQTESPEPTKDSAPENEVAEPEAEVSTPKEEAEEASPEASSTEEEDAHSDRIAKARKELADLDDLDV